MIEKTPNAEFSSEQTKIHKRDANLEKMNKLTEKLPAGIARDVMIAIMEKYINKTERLEKGLSNPTLKDYYEKLGLDEAQIIPFLDISKEDAEETIGHELEGAPEIQEDIKNGQIAKVAEYIFKKGGLTVRILACLLVLSAYLDMNDTLRKIDQMPNPMDRLEYVVPDGSERVKMFQKCIDEDEKKPVQSEGDLLKHKEILNMIIGTKFVEIRKSGLSEKDKLIIDEKVKAKSEELEKVAEDVRKTLSADLKNATTSNAIASAYDKCWKDYWAIIYKYKPKYAEEIKGIERDLGKLKAGDDDVSFVLGHELRKLLQATMERAKNESDRILDEKKVALESFESKEK